MFWIPSAADTLIDVDVHITPQNGDDGWGNLKQHDMINSIKVMSGDITDQMRHYDLSGSNGLALKNAVANYLAAPESLVEIISSKEIQHIVFPPKPIDPGETDF